MIAFLLLLLPLLAAPVHAANTCNAFVRTVEIAGPPFAALGNVYRLTYGFSAGRISGGSTVTLSRFRYELDCSSAGPLGIPCLDAGALIEYQGDATITSDCGVSWSTGHPIGALPNEVIFVPSAPIVIPAETVAFCSISFDLKVVSVVDTDPTPGTIEAVPGFAVGDAACDNGLSSAGSQSNAIMLCMPCDDDDECTIDSCLPETGACTHVEDTQNPACNPGLQACGESITAPCEATFGGRAFSRIQAAVDAAPDGTVIEIRGLCVENVTIDGRHNLTLSGLPSLSGTCPPSETDPLRALTTVLRGNASAASTDVLKIRDSTGILVQFLNIVDGGTAKTGVEVRLGNGNMVNCNCITRNLDGVEFDAHTGGQASQNLVFANNRDGIFLHRATTMTTAVSNISRNNLDDGIDVVDSSTDLNVLRSNISIDNVRNGIKLVDADRNSLLLNLVQRNGIGVIGRGIVLIAAGGLRGADHNVINDNLISDNGDLLLDRIICEGPIRNRFNTGNNVPLDCQN